MGQKVKGGMWCLACQKPVMGMKNTHRVRNAASTLALPVTAPFLGPLMRGGFKNEGYICPTCGGPACVRRVRKPSPLMDMVIKPLASKAYEAIQRRRD